MPTGGISFSKDGVKQIRLERCLSLTQWKCPCRRLRQRRVERGNRVKRTGVSSLHSYQKIRALDEKFIGRSGEEKP